MVAREWETVALDELLERSAEIEDVADDVEYKQVTLRIRGRGIALRGIAHGSKIRTKRQYKIETDQLLVSKIDARNGAFGLVPQALDGAIVTQDFPAFDIDRERCLSAFMWLLVTRPEFWDECLLASEGSTNRVRLNIDEFLGLEVDLPPLDEQRVIVDAVTAADDAGTAASEERQAAFEVLRAAIEELVVPNGHWEKLPEGWELAELGDVADVRSGITKGRKTDEPLEPVPFLRAANVQHGYLDLAEIKTIDVTATEKVRFRVERGDVLMVEGGNAEHLGRGWIWDGEIGGCLHQNHVFRARPNVELIEPRFLSYSIAASPARAYCLDKAKKTTNLASINKTQISALPVPLPPRDEQGEIVRKLDAIRAAAVKTTVVHSRLRDVRAALVDSLLSGDRRIRKPVATVEELATA